MKEPLVEILLATYNGELFLRELIASLLAQDHENILITAHDDGSKDNTMEILLDYHALFPEKIRIISGPPTGGAADNFSYLLSFSKADYVMFCDQDDVWLPEKIAITFAKMKKMQDEYGVGTPLLVHTDLQVVDKDLRLINRSFWRYQKINPEKDRLERLLVQNVVTGCTVMINRALVDLCLSSPKSGEIIMHDWWLALIATVFGRIGFVPKATIMYRQHGGNDTGAKPWCTICAIFNGFAMFKKEKRDKLLKSLSSTWRQAEAFQNLYGSQMSKVKYSIVSSYANMSRLSSLERKLMIIRYGFYKVGVLRNIGMLVRI